MITSIFFQRKVVSSAVTWGLDSMLRSIGPFVRMFWILSGLSCMLMIYNFTICLLLVLVIHSNDIVYLKKLEISTLLKSGIKCMRFITVSVKCMYFITLLIRQIYSNQRSERWLFRSFGYKYISIEHQYLIFFICKDLVLIFMHFIIINAP